MHQLSSLFIENRNKLTLSRFAFFLLLPLCLLILAQCNSQTELVNPEQFDQYLPQELPANWEKDKFKFRSLESNNWGGATYTGGPGGYIQVGIRHFIPSRWEEKKSIIKENDDAIQLGDYTGSISEAGESTIFEVYFGNNFTIRAEGPDLTKENFVELIGKIPLEKINSLAKSS